jgi:hypothetical protein
VSICATWSLSVFRRNFPGFPLSLDINRNLSSILYLIMYSNPIS